MTPGPEIFIIAALVICFGAMLQASTGIGAGLVAFPILALLSMKLVPGPLIFSSFFLSIYMALKGRKHIRFTSMRVLAVGIIIGTVIGGYALSRIPGQYLGIFFGVLLLLVVVISLGGIRLKYSSTNMFSMGAAAGFMGITVASGSPFVALIYQHEPGSTVRATLSLIYLFGCLLTLCILSMTGRFGFSEFLYGLYLTPGYIAGYLLSGKIVAYLDTGYLRKIILFISFISALALILKSL